jgi:hypothetical protein
VKFGDAKHGFGPLRAGWHLHPAWRRPPSLAQEALPPHLAVSPEHHRTRMPPRSSSSADIDAMVARVAPAILELLGDGVPRSRRAIIAALAERHPKDEVKRTLMRLAVTDRVVESGGKYGLAAPLKSLVDKPCGRRRA